MRANAFLLQMIVPLCLATPAWPGGSNYAVAPGKRPDFVGAISEWPVPNAKFARDPAPGPDGNIYITVMYADRIARFDPRTKSFTEWKLPAGAKPHGLLVDERGNVWYTGNGNGTIGRLDPATGKVSEFKAPSGGDPHTLVTDGKGTIWFTVQAGNRIGRLDMVSGVISEYNTSGNPYGIALDHAGKVWFCQISGGKLGKLDPVTGSITELSVGSDSRPRRMAVAPDGMLWVTLFGSGKLLKVDPEQNKVLREYALPGGPNGGPYAVTVDGAGLVWANEIQTDTVIRLHSDTDKIDVFKLPGKDSGIRKMIVDAGGRLWYMGSHSGRLGVIE